MTKDAGKGMDRTPGRGAGAWAPGPVRRPRTRGLRGGRDLQARAAPRSGLDGHTRSGHLREIDDLRRHASDWTAHQAGAAVGSCRGAPHGRVPTVAHHPPGSPRHRTGQDPGFSLAGGAEAPLHTAACPGSACRHRQDSETRAGRIPAGWPGDDRRCPTGCARMPPMQCCG